jgi:homoserine kinase type II
MADASLAEAPIPRAPAALAAAGSDRSDARSSAPESMRLSSRDAARDLEYDTFDRFELAIVISHWSTGSIELIEEFRRGGRRAPKVLIRSARGRYLLKRRAPGRDDPARVAFSHAIQAELSAKQFPLPHLLATRDKRTHLELNGFTYELFEFIPGSAYNQSLEATADAGRVQALYHKLLQHFAPPVAPPTGSYHNAPSVDQSFDRILRHLANRSDVTSLCRFLLDSYLHARDSVEDAGISRWPAQIVHGDWHPGNMLFMGDRIVAVIDYDSARLLPRIVDTANGALQFSLLGGAGNEDLSRWPAHIDEARFRRFLRGYDAVTLLSQAELRATPWLMIEALVAESVYPIAATGQFGKLEGAAFLEMVQRKIVWLQQNADRLVESVAT